MVGTRDLAALGRLPFLKAVANLIEDVAGELDLTLE